MFENREGKRVPQVTFRVRQDGEWHDVTTDDLFKGKTVVVFSLPGAFTPTCSGSHVPRFNELAGVLKANGVDDIICISVNDTFVMNEWKKTQQADNITFIPDGNGEFTEGMGMLVEKNDLGFGKRSWRYSMLVKDGIIEKMFIEPDVPGDPFEVSDADTMLEYIKILREAGVEFEEIQLGDGISIRAVRAATGADTVPQVFVNGEYLGDSAAVAERYGRKVA